MGLSHSGYAREQQWWHVPHCMQPHTTHVLFVRVREKVCRSMVPFQDPESSLHSPVFAFHLPVSQQVVSRGCTFVHRGWAADHEPVMVTSLVEQSATTSELPAAARSHHHATYACFWNLAFSRT